MKTTLGVALTPPSAAALIAGACLLAAACLPTCHGRDYASAAAPAASPCAATAEPAREIAAEALDEAAEAAQAARYPPGAAQMQGHAASGQR